MVIVTSYYIDEYHGEHFFVTGILENVSFDIAGSGNYVIELRINGDEYEIMRPRNSFQVLPYDFGVKGENALDAIHALQVRLEGNIGRTAHLEYIQFEKRVLGLTLGDTEYLNADAVLKDHIAYQSLGRNIFAVAFVITLIPFIIILLRLRHKSLGDTLSKGSKW